MLLCQKCGYDNELGRIFCHQCGAKLDLDAIKPPSRGGKALKPKRTHTVARWIRHVVELAIFAAVLYVAFLMLQVIPEPAKPTMDEETVASKKWLTVERMVTRKQASSVEVSPSEAKAYLASLKVQKTNLNWGAVPDRIWIEFASGSVELNILATMHLGGALERKVWLTYSGVPKIQDGQITFEATGGTVGRLNLPLKLLNALGLHRHVFGEVFGRLTSERDVLSQMSRIEVRPDRVIVHYQPR